MARNKMIDRILSDENMKTAKQRLFQKVADTELSLEEIETAFAEYRRTKDKIRKEILNMSWKPEPAKAVHILKKDGSERVVMVLSPLDRLIQEAAAEVLEKMLKPRLSKSVYQYDQFMGVRKVRQKCLSRLADGRTWVLQADIENCSENLDRSVVMKHLAELFEEEEALVLYRQLITVTDQLCFDERLEARGIYASSSLTNLMMDLCLSDLDRILDHQSIRFVRYGDDYMLFFRTPEEAVDWFEKIREILHNQLGLSLNAHKTAIQNDRYGPYLGRRFVLRNNRFCMMNMEQQHSCTRVEGYLMLIPEEKKKLTVRLQRRGHRENKKTKQANAGVDEQILAGLNQNQIFFISKEQQSLKNT
ncbi:reverse transcriptase domain-containing protein [Ileibacterium valens]|uniref:reverse transcriptase domain-containing protein n=1 Tax=Ileibacterium valens TaxID=1862668 RepID=UPI0035131A78